MKYKKRLNLETVKAVWEKTGGLCWYCGTKLDMKSRYSRSIPSTYIIDHVIPLLLGGSNNLSNLVPSCRTCNSRKGRKTLEEFRASCSRKNAGMPYFNSAQIKYLASYGIELPKTATHIFYFEKEKLRL